MTGSVFVLGSQLRFVGFRAFFMGALRAVRWAAGRLVLCEPIAIVTIQPRIRIRKRMLKFSAAHSGVLVQVIKPLHSMLQFPSLCSQLFANSYQYLFTIQHLFDATGRDSKPLCNIAAGQADVKFSPDIAIHRWGYFLRMTTNVDAFLNCQGFHGLDGNVVLPSCFAH